MPALKLKENNQIILEKEIVEKEEHFFSTKPITNLQGQLNLDHGLHKL